MVGSTQWHVCTTGEPTEAPFSGTYRVQRRVLRPGIGCLTTLAAGGHAHGFETPQQVCCKPAFPRSTSHRRPRRWRAVVTVGAGPRAGAICSRPSRAEKMFGMLSMRRGSAAFGASSSFCTVTARRRASRRPACVGERSASNSPIGVPSRAARRIMRRASQAAPPRSGRPRPRHLREGATVSVSPGFGTHR